MRRISPLTLGLFQFHVLKGNLQTNLDAITQAARDAQARGVDWLLLPELFSSSYDLEHAERWGEINTRETLPALSKLARENHLAIAGTCLLPLPGGGIGNTLVWIDDRGEETARYIKLHRFRPMNEDRFLKPGQAPVLAATPFGPVGLSICYDIRFPELYRFYATRGARFFALPSQWPRPRQKHFETLIRARAIENQAIIIAVNRVGSEAGHHFFGHSMVIDPWGETICNARDEEILLVCMLDPTEIDKIRRDFPVIGDIRHDIWQVTTILTKEKEHA